jgi:aryl-alcohol dehydrogenase-like predicted oxidoreductase
MDLTAYRTLGRSGLIVSPLTLGTMTFGTPRWGSTDEEAEQVFNQYVDAGGTSIDTADVYAKGRSEELVGQFIARRGLRDNVVLATKSSFFAGTPGVPHGGGNSRKHVYAALDASLERLGTDYVDLYWLHVWDGVTPVEDVLQTMGDLVRAGKVRYFGLSDVPAWYATKMATLAAAHGVPGPISLQMEYSLIARAVEYEHIPAALELGLGLSPWGPIGAGFLAGKYTRPKRGVKGEGEGRLSGPNPYGDQLFTERNWAVLDRLRSVAEGMGRPLAQVALAWVNAQAGVTSSIIGARTPEQLTSHLASLEIRLTQEQLKTLDEASAVMQNPWGIFSHQIRKGIFGGTTVQSWQEAESQRRLPRS